MPVVHHAVVGYRSIAAAPGGVWTTVYQWDTSGVLADHAGYNGLTLVGTIPITDFTQTGGTRIRLTFSGATSEGFIANAMYVGNGGGGDPYDFGDTPVQMLMSGGGTITIPINVDTVTDDVAFVKDATNPFVYAMQFSNAAADTLRGNATGQDENSYFKSAQEASVANKTVFSNNLTTSYVAKIELFI